MPQEKYGAFNIFKSVFLEIQNKAIRPVLSDLVTYVYVRYTGVYICNLT